MNFEDFNLEKYYSDRKSSRHHYVPKFLVDGFTENGQVFVYDKSKDKILSKTLHPKSIFFETDRNTIEFPQNNKSSIIEDEYYFKVDNHCSKIIKKYQTKDINSIMFDYEDEAYISYFLNSLFWRVPRNDEAANEILDETQMFLFGKETDQLNGT